MQFVVAELFSASPSEYLESLLNIVASNIGGEEGEPLPVMQLAAIASLVSDDVSRQDCTARSNIQ